MVCFGESLSENTLIIGEINGGEGEFYVRVYDDVGNLLYSKTNETKVIFSFTSNAIKFNTSLEFYGALDLCR